MKLNKKALEDGMIQTVIICRLQTVRIEVSKTIEGFYRLYNLNTRKVIGTYSNYRIMRGVLADLIR